MAADCVSGAYSRAPDVLSRFGWPIESGGTNCTRSITLKRPASSCPAASIEKLKKRGPVTMSDSSESPAVHASEPHVGGLAQKLNWLRAGVLGANDGIVSTAGLVVGVAAATPHTGPILTAGV